MIQITPHMRILVAVEAQDFRKGIDGLARVCREALSADPFDGALFVFRNRRGTAIKCLVYDSQGFWLAQNQPSSHYTSSSSIRASRVGCRRRLPDGRSVDEPVPSTALLDRRIRPGILVEPRVAVGGMRANDAVLSPSDDGVFVDAETLRHFRLREHASIPKSIVP